LLPTARSSASGPALAVFLFLPVAASASTASPLPRGQVIPRIVCAGQPDRAYALYLPSGYRADRPWPIVYAFDSRGIDYGKDMIELLVPGAERFGFMVASSGDSSNVVPMEENFRSLRAIWVDTHDRLAIDGRRAYAFAFSGMTRFTVTAALRAPGTFAGIVGASGGYPLGHPPSRKETPFPFFGMVGDKDFNYYEMLDTESRLAAEGLPHRLEIFAGSHEWPAAELVARSLGWLELNAMKNGTREKDAALVEALWSEDLARGRALEAEGKLWRAWRAYRAAAADFAGLRDTGPAKERAAALASSEALRRDLERRSERDRRAREYLERAPRRFAAVGPEIRPDSVSQLLSDLQVPDLKRKAKSDDAEERLSAERLLYAVYIQTGLYLPRSLMEKKQWERAILFLQVAGEIDPESSRIPYRLATAYAGKGNRKKALESLHRAVEMKGTDRAEIENEPAFAGLRQEPGYQELVGVLARSGKP
jgi:tetratricopeptide (TPR) repeat protein